LFLGLDLLGILDSLDFEGFSLEGNVVSRGIIVVEVVVLEWRWVFHQFEVASDLVLLIDVWKGDFSVIRNVFSIVVLSVVLLNVRTDVFYREEISEGWLESEESDFFFDFLELSSLVVVDVGDLGSRGCKCRWHLSREEVCEVDSLFSFSMANGDQFTKVGVYFLGNSVFFCFLEGIEVFRSRLGCFECSNSAIDFVHVSIVSENATENWGSEDVVAGRLFIPVVEGALHLGRLAHFVEGLAVLAVGIESGSFNGFSVLGEAAGFLIDEVVLLNEWRGLFHCVVRGRGFFVDVESGSC
jgi:hypothetical protein